MKKYLKGNKKRYFSLKIIVLYSTLHKLIKFEIEFLSHKMAFNIEERKTSPPLIQLFAN